MSADQEHVMDFPDLTAEQRAVAWAVVRSIATALWVAATVTVVISAIVFGREGEVSAPFLVSLAGLLSLAVAMEVKSRDLEKTPDA
jgi:hypothetical protein